MVEKMTVEKATELARQQGFHCSQVVIMHASELLGLDKELMTKMAGGLGGGFYNGDMCGCAGAAIMALCAKYGFSEPNSPEQNQIMIGKVKEFEAKFKEKTGALTCKDLLGGYNIAIPEEAAIIKEQGLNKNCPLFMTQACEILDEMLEE